MAASLGQMVFGLAVVVALLLASLWLIKRLSVPRGPAAGLKLLGGISIGTREKLVLVEIGDKVLVLGVTANQINTLHTLDASTLPAPSNTNDTKRQPDFSTRLKQSLERRKHD